MNEDKSFNFMVLIMVVSGLAITGGMVAFAVWAIKFVVNALA